MKWRKAPLHYSVLLINISYFLTYSINQSLPAANPYPSNNNESTRCRSLLSFSLQLSHPFCWSWHQHWNQYCRLVWWSHGWAREWLSGRARIRGNRRVSDDEMTHNIYNNQPSAGGWLTPRTSDRIQGQWQHNNIHNNRPLVGRLWSNPVLAIYKTTKAFEIC